MKKKPNIKIGIIINIALTVLSIVYMFIYYIERNGFEFNHNSLEFFIYLFCSIYSLLSLGSIYYSFYFIVSSINGRE